MEQVIQLGDWNTKGQDSGQMKRELMDSPPSTMMLWQLAGPFVLCLSSRW